MSPMKDRIDPDAKLRMALDKELPARLRLNAAVRLRDWCSGGGRPPHGFMDRHSAADAMRELIKGTLVPIIMAEDA
jgi:hypothetical protein